MIRFNFEALDRAGIKPADLLVHSFENRPRPPATLEPSQSRLTADSEQILSNLIAKYASVAKGLGYIR